MEYDFIGDVHGHGDKLEALLRKMGYEHRAGAWRHRSRMAIFVGDFIDRGPRQMDTINIVRAMIDAGSALAVMGNHELNAIGWITPSMREPGEFLRQRGGEKGSRNFSHHKEFLSEVKSDSPLHREVVDWFMTLPLWIDLPEARAVHACWHPRAVETIKSRLGEIPLLTENLLHEAIDESGPQKKEGTLSLFEAVELVCKGVEIELPQGRSYVDPSGFVRTRVRVRWWDESATTFKTSAMLSESFKEEFPDEMIPEDGRVVLPKDKPLFFGHYWMSGHPRPLGKLVACVDYSAAKNGPLVAYRYSGERELAADRFVSSDDA